MFAATADGTTSLEIPAPAGGSVIRLEGFDQQTLVASHQLTV